MQALASFRYALVAAVFAVPGAAAAQQAERILDRNLHAWYMYFGDHEVGGGPWGIHFDGQWRRQGVGRTWQQLLLRPGINYDFNPQVQVSGGYAFIRSYPYGDYPAQSTTPEHRIWQQLLLRQTVSRFKLAHRFRLEQRFVGIRTVVDGDDRSTDYSRRNRFRYFVKGAVPIRNGGTDSEIFVAVYNEVMFNFGRDTANIFDQNRAYVAVGRKLPGFGAVEAGYLQQTVQQRNGRILELNHTLQIGLFSTLGFGRR